MRRPEPSNLVDIRERWRVHLRRGVRSLEAGRHDCAAQHFAAAYRIAPECPEVCLALGREYLRRGQLTLAEPLLRRAWAGNPGLAVAAAAMARLLGVGRGDLAGAREVLAEGLRRHPRHALLLVVQGELELEEDLFGAARESFLKAQELGADAAAIRIGLARTFNAEGIAWGEAGADERAIFAFKRASTLDPTWSGPLVNLGVVFSRLGRQRRARRCYEEAITLEPENPVAFFNLGNLLRETGDTLAAVECYEQVLELAPDYPGGRSNLAEVLAEEGRYDRAVELYREALITDDENPSLWSNLGLALIACGIEDEGEHCLRRSLELDPKSFCACCNLAALLVCQGRHREAAKFARRARALDPARARCWLADVREDVIAPLPMGLLPDAGTPAHEPTNTNG